MKNVRVFGFSFVTQLNEDRKGSMSWELLHKYVRGDCTEKELRQLADWLQQNAANEDFFTSFIEEWSEEERVEFNTDARAAWEQFRVDNLKTDSVSEGATSPSLTTEQTEIKTYSIGKKRNGHGLVFWGYSAAAAILLLVALVFMVEQFQFAETPPAGEEPSYQEISTVQGQRTNLRLSDGTKVVLNSSSSLRIPKNYGLETRTLYLKGEAFFEVIHDEQNPFIVVSHGTYTKDLGTQFNVSAYDSTTIEVAVKEGLVSMGKVEKGSIQKEVVELTPNKLGILKKVGGLTVSDISDIDQHVGWARGRLVFRSTPFPKVMEQLERWFDINCQLETSANSEISRRTLTATYDNMPMTEVLKVLSISMNVSYRQQGRTIIFSDGKNQKTEQQVNTNQIIGDDV